MADDYETAPGAGGVKFRSDDDGTRHWPVFKIAFGADGERVEVTDSAGFRVPALSYQGGAWSIAVNNFPATQAVTQSGAWSVSITGSVAVTGPLTDAQLRASAVPVSGAFFQATQPVSIAATVTVDSELPAAAALADNTANPTVPGVGAFGLVWDGATWDRVTQPLTDTQLRATPVPVSGTVTANAGTNLNTSALLLDATFTGRINTQGQKAMAASTPVVLASDQAAIPVTATLVAGGDVDVLTLPADPLGANADAIVAAGAAGSISAKLRRTTQGLEDLKTTIVLAAGANNIGDVDVLTVPADPFGANADAIVAAGAVGSIQAKLRRATQGLEDLKTLIVLGAGNNNIGDVDVASVPADPFGLNADASSATGSISAKLKYLAALFKAEDAAHSAGDFGMPVLGFRNDANADSAGSNGDWAIQSMDAGGNANIRPRPDVARQQLTSAGLTTATTAYVSGDTLGNQFTIANAGRKSGGGGYITGVVMLDETAVTGAVDLFVFDSSVTPAADNVANSWSDADIIKLVAIIPLAGAYQSALNRIAQSGSIRVPYVCSGSTSLFASLVTRSGHTFFGAATSIKLTILLEPS